MDSLGLLIWIDSRLGQGITHTGRGFHTGWNSVHQAQLSWKIEFVLSNAALEEWLLWAAELQLVNTQEVVSDTDDLSFVVERVAHRSPVKLDFVDDVLTLVAPIRDDSLALKLLSASLLGHLDVSCPVEDVLDPIEATLCRHKFKD